MSCPNKETPAGRWSEVQSLGTGGAYLLSRLAIAVIVALVLISFVEGDARISVGSHDPDPDCAALGGTVVPGGAPDEDECVISASQANKAGTYHIRHNLRLADGVAIDATGPGTGGLTVIVDGDMALRPGSVVEANDDTGTDADGARPLTIHVARDFQLRGSLLAENQMGAGSGGAIEIKVGGDFEASGTISSAKAGPGDSGGGGDVSIEIGGNLEDGGLITSDATGAAGSIEIRANQLEGNSHTISAGYDRFGATEFSKGGPITITTGCQIQFRGTISSKGMSPGADRVRLQGCAIDLMAGAVVESIAAGGPATAETLCDDASKPADAIACVEIIASSRLYIHSSATVRADLDMSGGGGGTSWIDFFGQNIGPANELQSDTTNGIRIEGLVHANQVGGAGGSGGAVTAKARTHDVLISGTVQAHTAQAGGDGGLILVEAANSVNITGTLDASGDSAAGDGGQIDVKAYNANVAWTVGTGDVRPNATGSIDLVACTTVTTGANFNSEVPGQTTGACGGAPDTPSLDPCSCGPRPRLSLIIRKVTDPSPDQDDTSYEFNPSWSATNFFLKDGEEEVAQADVLEDPDVPTPDEPNPLIPPGVYSVEEVNVPPGWNVSAFCTSSLGHTETVENIGLDPHEQIICTFTNTRTIVDTDADDDGIPDVDDNCVSTPNPDQRDTDGDGLGNACDDDDDADGILDAADNCDLVPNLDQADPDNDGLGNACDEDDDADGVPDTADNCPLTPNTGQLDSDGDGLGNACDEDDDADGVPDTADNCVLIPNAGQTDTDGDGQGDACDSDDDGDGIPDATDNCALLANPGQEDADADGIGDGCDADPYSVPALCAGMTFDKVIVGTSGNDKITGGNGRQLIFGLGGDDDIHGGNDADCIVGGPGTDDLKGGNGADLIIGGVGDDVIDGGAEGDGLYGDAGNDDITGDNGNDLISAGSGADIVKGDQGNDTIDGEEGNDSLQGGPGNDTVSGGGGADYCVGETEAACET
jgi:hypothetical protein